MNNIDKLIDSIGANFERILRWVYSGALFIVLLYASRPEFLSGQEGCGQEGLYSKIGIWGLVAGALVIGAILYLIQGYVVSYIVTVSFILLKWDVRQGLQKEPKGKTTNPCCCRRCRCIERFFDLMAEATRDRWSDKVPKRLNNYLNYAWATYHAVLMTGWLTIIIYSVNEQGSIFSSKHMAWAVLPPAILLLAGGIFTYLLLSRIRLEDP